ncbi:MAG: HAMP domain-containing sensor histidine kinase [Actinomycetota bacterium]|nr:HAMP domain-containing sensor histidine kinase [Actinomycetota bacterium]
MSLRVRLTLGLVVLAAFGLTVAGVVTYRTLRSFLYDQIDERLEQVLPGPGPVVELPFGGYFQQRGDDGEILAQSGPVFTDDPAPALPEHLPEGPFTVSSEDGSARYRAQARDVRGGSTVIVALPLEDVDDTTQRLLVTELIVAGFVLATLAALGWWFVRRELRPLEDMGDTAGAIAAGDLSQRVESENENTEVGRLGIALNAMLAQIEAAFAERTASEDRLRRFVADASHELRTPLTSIRGYSELFRRGADERPEDLAKAMRRIEEEAARMGVLVDDLLLLARLDQGRPLAQEPVDLTRLAEDAVSDARTVAPDRTVRFAPNGAVTVLGDESRLRQVLANLLSNAYTHTPPGTTVDVAVKRDGDDAVVVVADDGPGFSAETAEHAFDRFWREDASRARASGGVGLGLAIVAAIATAHGGSAEVESTPGAGATFRVRLPLQA